MFGTSGVRGEVGTEITCSLALSVGRAVASAGYDRVVVGRDPRESGPMFADAVAAGLRECGSDGVRIGVAATPTVARAVRAFDADAGVAVTASHNPAPDNGLKLWNPSGMAFDESQRAAISRRVREDDYALQGWTDLGSQERREDATAVHARALRESTDDLSGLSVVVDVGNGAGGVTADVLSDLGCDVSTLNAQPDGRFPGRPSEPTRDACRTLRDTVAATDADLGVAHDGDADRAMAVTERGEFVPKDVLFALFAREAASEGDRVAAPIDTSLAVADAVSSLGASLVRTRVGDVYVAERARDSGVVFGGEPSGAWIWPDETLCPDGSLAACRLAELVRARGPLGDLVDDIERYPIRRGNVSVERKRAVMERVAERVSDRYESVDDRDGVRVDTDDGWFLVRASGTQPPVRLTAEARSEKRTQTLFETATALVEDATEHVRQPDTISPQ
jgi:phosphoglucosamine mutase